MTDNIPEILQKGIQFLKFLDQPYGIIPISVYDGKKRPMCKIKGFMDNIYRVGDKSFITQWQRAKFAGLVTHPGFNPDITKQLFVIDVDIPTEGGHDQDGRLHLHNLDIPDTFTVQTPSGGIHYIMWAPMDFRFKHNPYPGIDLVFKSPFYFICMGSPGYKLVNKKHIADAPQSLLDTLMYVKEDEVVKDGVKLSIFDNIMENGIPSGQRHDTLLRLMASLVKRRIPKPEAMGLAELCIQKCEQTDGLPTMDECSAQYDDAQVKFVSGHSLDDLLENLVLLTANNSVKDMTKTKESAVAAGSLMNIYPQMLPNLNKPQNQHGHFPLSKLGQVWLDSPDKRIVSRIGYFPSDDILYSRHDVDYFNVYTQPQFELPTTWDELLIRKIENVFKRTYGPIYQDWLKVLKYKLLHPEVKFSWAIYLTSQAEGTGKGLSWKLTQQIFGYNNCLNINATEFNARFNMSYSQATFTLVDEAHGVVTKSSRNYMMNALKRIITEDTMTIEEKNMEKEMGVESFFFMYIFSNDRTSLELNKDSRRFLVYHDDQPKTAEEVKLMNEVGDLIHDPTVISQFIAWMMATVDITISDDFNPKGEARKTDDLLSSGDDVYLSPEVEKIKSDIDACDGIFVADVITRSMFEYYCRQEFGNRYHKVFTDTLKSGMLTQLKSPTRTNKHQKLMVYVNKLDHSLATSGVEMMDAYKVGIKHQVSVFIVRDCTDIPDLSRKDLLANINAELKKNGPRKSGPNLTPVH